MNANASELKPVPLSVYFCLLFAILVLLEKPLESSLVYKKAGNAFPWDSGSQPVHHDPFAGVAVPDTLYLYCNS